MKNHLLTLGAAALLSPATAQVHIFQTEGVAYTIASAAAATNGGSGTLTYRWSRDGVIIGSSNSATYTVAAADAYGREIKFERCVQNSNCAQQWLCAEPLLITFCSSPSGDCTLPSNYCNGGERLGSTCWANFNVSTNGSFAADHAHASSCFYQFNRNTEWATTGTVTNWTNSISESSDWTAANSPCPSGWRLPSRLEFSALNNMGSSWAAANARGNVVAGCFFGPNSGSCSLPSTMAGCVFLPACGYRAGTDGALSYQGFNGHYWSSTQNSSKYGYYWNFASTGSFESYNDKAFGMLVRCVQ